MKYKISLREVLLIFVLGFAVYLNSFWINFIWDDIALILDNPMIKSFSRFFNVFSNFLSVHGDKFYRPLQNITYQVDFFFYKFDYRGYHLTNIVLHIFTVLALYKVLLLLTRHRYISLYSSLMYLVCPLWVESVAYISGRADILMGLFILTSFGSFLENKIILGLLLYLLALLSKEVSLAYPFSLVLFLILFGKKEKKDFFKAGLFFLVSLFYWFCRYVAGLNFPLRHPDQPILSRIVILVEAIPRYLGMIFFPINQHMSYSTNVQANIFSPDFIMLLLVCLFLAALFIYFVKREKFVSFFIGWFIIFFIPQSGIVPINAYFSEHFIYLAAVGIFVSFVYLVDKIRLRKAGNLVIFAYLVVFSFATIRYNFIWQDPVRFYKRIIKLSPNSFTAYNNLSVVYLDNGDLGEAERFLKEAIKLSPDFTEARLNLARLYYLKNDYPRSIGLAKGVLESSPKSSLAFNYLGTFYFKSGQFALADDCFRRAVKLNPVFLPYLIDLCSFYEAVGKPGDAGMVLEVIGRLDKYALAELYYKQAKELFETGRVKEALLKVDNAILINSRSAVFYSLKGQILKKNGDYPEAVNCFRKALLIVPRSWVIYNNLGNALALKDDFLKAQECFFEAIRLNPLCADTYFNLGLLYFERKDFTQADKYFQKCLDISDNHLLAKEYLRKAPEKH